MCNLSLFRIVLVNNKKKNLQLRWLRLISPTIIHYWALLQLLTTSCGHDLPAFFSCFANQIMSGSADEVWFLPPVFPMLGLFSGQEVVLWAYSDQSAQVDIWMLKLIRNAPVSSWFMFSKKNWKQAKKKKKKALAIGPEKLESGFSRLN